MLPQQILLDLGLADDLDQVQRHLVSAAHALGFELVAAVMIRGELATGRAWMKAIDNTPAGYLEAQKSLDDTLRDPVMTALRAAPLPVVYDQGLYVREGAADLWDAQAEWGYRTGIASAMHEASHLEQFMLGVDRPEALPADPAQRARLLAGTQLLTIYAQAAVRRCLDGGASTAVLSAVVRDSLRWAADGVTVAEIGDRLAIADGDVVRLQRRGALATGEATAQAAGLRLLHGA